MHIDNLILASLNFPEITVNEPQTVGHIANDKHIWTNDEISVTPVGIPFSFGQRFHY